MGQSKRHKPRRRYKYYSKNTYQGIIPITLVNKDRQLKSKDRYCIYRRKKNNELVCIIQNDLLCHFVYNSEYTGCKRKVKAFQEDLKRENESHHDIPIHFTKIQQHISPSQYPISTDNEIGVQYKNLKDIETELQNAANKKEKTYKRKCLKCGAPVYMDTNYCFQCLKYEEFESK